MPKTLIPSSHKALNPDALDPKLKTLNSEPYTPSYPTALVTRKSSSQSETPSNPNTTSPKTPTLNPKTPTLKP